MHSRGHGRRFRGSGGGDPPLRRVTPQPARDRARPSCRAHFLRPPAPPPGGRAGGPASRAATIFDAPGAAARVVVICDASGSMVSKWDWLVARLPPAIGSLGSDRSFGLVLARDNKAVVLDTDRLW